MGDVQGAEMASLSGFIITLICISEAYPLRNNYVSSVCSVNEVKLKSSLRIRARCGEAVKKKHSFCST